MREKHQFHNPCWMGLDMLEGKVLADVTLLIFSQWSGE